MFGFFAGGRSATFEAKYRVYPVSFIDKPHLEHGDKVVLPPSALDRLTQLHIQYPMVFEISNPSQPKVSHCGVMEFCAEEGTCYIPYWMMQNLLLSEGSLIQFKSATLPKGTYVKIQPHTTDFLDISNPKAVLETSLRHYSCLTKGDTVLIQYNGRNYYIDIKEAKPQDAVSIIETDCEVDFEAPKDYVEPEPSPKPVASTAAPAPALGGSGPAGVKGRRVGLKRQASSAKETEEPEEDAAPKFNAFSGGGYKLSSGRKLTGDGAGPSSGGGSVPGRAGHMNAPVSWSALQKQSAGNGGGGGGGDKGGEEGDKEDKFAAFKGRANKLR